MMCIDMHFHSIFFLFTFFTFKHIFIDSYTQEPNKIKVHPWGSGWRDNFSKKNEKWENNMAKFAKLMWLAAVHLFYFCFSFLLFILSKQKKEEKKRKA